MNRMRHMILVAGAIASMTVLTVGQASAASIPPRTVEIVGNQDLGASSGEVFYFKQGRIVAFFPSNVTPEDPALRAAITRALAAS